MYLKYLTYFNDYLEDIDFKMVSKSRDDSFCKALRVFLGHGLRKLHIFKLRAQKLISRHL